MRELTQRVNFYVIFAPGCKFNERTKAFYIIIYHLAGVNLFTKSKFICVFCPGYKIFERTKAYYRLREVNLLLTPAYFKPWSEFLAACSWISIQFPELCINKICFKNGELFCSSYNHCSWFSPPAYGIPSIQVM